MTHQPGTPPASPHPLVVVMGVSGSGKSTVGAALADALGVPFTDADGLHPAANVAKMESGVPLTDDDRRPWLDAVGAELAGHAGTGLVVACSALRRAYRDRLRSHAPATVFVHLCGDRTVLGERITGRSGHFMPPALLDSQLDTLEPLTADEAGATLDIRRPVDELVAGATAAATGPEVCAR
ncbi:gluconokinase [Pseudonocardia spirodelae]|uniref:Gluconokinase n=1 Tax=Pseudonocardia spirodelae TaxID=3133431 RepID=A0ABU8T558_9PSEU